MHGSLALTSEYILAGKEVGSTLCIALGKRRRGLIADSTSVLEQPERQCVMLCGPPSMIEDVSGMFRQMGVPDGRVFYEKWW